jgi:HD-GYP domain-containing protein (c-di-GMP phosphodiesterase class II)/ferredoxin
MARTPLTPVIRIDEEKCINCYACIVGCPVKYCMDGSGEKLLINADLCIGCGNCITVCTHKARTIIDDTDRFMEDLKQGKKIIAITAPSIASFFLGQFLNFNGYLKSLGVEAVFDVSFGAELSVLSYINYIKEKNPRTVIAQSCPAIVSFIEIYHPELIPYLAPADSPMLHTIKMIREYYPEYKNHKVAVISPCIAKRREFDETGMGDYNITMIALKNLMDKQKIDLSSFAPAEYTGEHAERAVGFSLPGGLLDTAERFAPSIRRHTRKIEGVHTIYPYLKEFFELLNTDTKLPLMIDCLNCEKGCNGGPGTGNAGKPYIVLENPIRKRRAKLEEYHRPEKREWVYKKYRKVLNKYWEKDLYNRSYRDLSGNNTLRHPGEDELIEIYHSLRKFKKEDLYNCTCCGYGNCNEMAMAIYNKLNKPENCAHYILALLREEDEIIQKKTKNILELQNTIMESVAELVDCRDKITGGHIARTSKYLKILINAMVAGGLYRDQTSLWNIDQMILSATLHDVGKIAISDIILNKTGKFTESEFEEMKKHTILGGEIIQHMKKKIGENDFLDYAYIFAVYHHEKWNGLGYPHGISGENIPLPARLIAIVDVFDALISSRPYKEIFSYEDAVKIIKDSGGSHFDPLLTNLFLYVSDQLINAAKLLK